MRIIASNMSRSRPTCRSKRSAPTIPCCRAAGWRRSTIAAINMAGGPIAKPIPSRAVSGEMQRSGTGPNRNRRSRGPARESCSGSSCKPASRFWPTMICGWKCSSTAKSEPAIAAPARYFFPSLIGGSNHDNFLAVFRTGFTSMLAMPFGDGITIRRAMPAKPRWTRVAATISMIEDEAGPWQERKSADR